MFIVTLFFPISIHQQSTVHSARWHGWRHLLERGERIGHRPGLSAPNEKCWVTAMPIHMQGSIDEVIESVSLVDSEEAKEWKIEDEVKVNFITNKVNRFHEIINTLKFSTRKEVFDQGSQSGGEGWTS